MFILATVVYFLVATMYSLIIYSGLRRLGKGNNTEVGTTSRLYAYRKITGIWLGSIIFWAMMVFLFMGDMYREKYITIIILAFIGLVIFFFVFYLTIFRKKTIELTDDIKKVNPKLGSAVQFNSGFSKNTGKEMIKLFVILVLAFAGIVLIAELLIKLNLI